jgi:hypothetical protein
MLYRFAIPFAYLLEDFVADLSIGTHAMGSGMNSCIMKVCPHPGLSKRWKIAKVNPTINLRIGALLCKYLMACGIALLVFANKMSSWQWGRVLVLHEHPVVSHPLPNPHAAEQWNVLLHRLTSHLVESLMKSDLTCANNPSARVERALHLDV